MDTLIAKSAKSVQDTLNKARLSCTVVELPSSTRTAVDAAMSIGCDVAQIVKSLIFQTEKSNKAVLVLTSGVNRVNEKQLALHLGEKIVKADAEFTREITGFAIGGIPPLGHKQTIELIFMDEMLLNFSEVWAAAGTPNAVFSIQGQALLAITQAKVISFTESKI